MIEPVKADLGLNAHQGDAAACMQLRSGNFPVNRVNMARENLSSDKSASKRGPAPTGVGTLIGVRLPPPNLSALDAWIGLQPAPRPTRPEAIRRLLAHALAKPADAGSIPIEELNANNDE